LFPALAGLAYAHIVEGHMKEARGLAEEFLELAKPHDDPLLLAVGHWLLAYTAWWQGDFVDVRTHSRQCLVIYDPNQHHIFVAAYGQDPGIVCGYLKAFSDWVLGYPTQATAAMEQTVTLARGLGHPGSIGLALLMSAQLSQLRREPEPARIQAEEAMAVTAEHGLHAVGLWCLLPRGWSIAQLGDVAGGISDIREAMDRRRAFGIGAVWPWFLALFAEACGAAGDFGVGLEALAEAGDWEQRNDERLYAAEVCRLKGELLCRQQVPELTDAQACFDQALATARDQHARSWELRAATSMARMWWEHGRSDDARALLSPVYDWFTEGFDTADLIDAKALLYQMNR
jgi:predicted ATPase